MKNKLIALIIILSTVLTLVTGSCTASQTKSAGQTIEIKRDDLSIMVTSDGSITAPQQFNLAFNSPQGGVVQDYYVEEGDRVRKGARLATLDPWKQINDIKTALFSVQTNQNSIDLGCDTDHLPYNYPDLSISRMADEAMKDMDTAAADFNLGNYKDAGYWLVMAYFDLQVCENLIETRPNAAQLAGAKNNSTYYLSVAAGGWQPITPDNQRVIAVMKLYREKLIIISNMMKDTNVPYQDISPQFENARKELSEVAQAAKSTMTIKSRMIYKYADTPTSVDFLQSSLRLLEELQQIRYSEEVPLKATLWNLYAAKLNLLVGKDVLENQTLIFESGGNINWKTLQDYNLKLQAAEINLYKAKREIMNTVIIAPRDGTIFSVNLKKNDVLSAEDYATRPAVGLCDTSIIKFAGQVDEIDIMKVHVGDNATVKVDAIPDKEFNWKVKFISPFGSKVGNVVKFDVTIISTSPPEIEFEDKLSATAEIQVARVKDVLLVPISYIISTPGGSMVMLVDNATTRAEPKRVTLGLQNFQYAEVTSGLSEGDKVQLPGKAAAGSSTSQQRSTNQGNAMRALH